MRLAFALLFLWSVCLVNSIYAVLGDEIRTVSQPLVANIIPSPPGDESPTPDCPSASSPAPNPLSAADWYRIHLENRSKITPIWAAVRYQVEGVWRGQGWWRLDAGKPAVWVAVTDKPDFVAYATDGKAWFWDGSQERHECDAVTFFNIRGPASTYTGCMKCGRLYHISARRPASWTLAFVGP